APAGGGGSGGGPPAGGADVRPDRRPLGPDPGGRRRRPGGTRRQGGGQRLQEDVLRGGGGQRRLQAGQGRVARRDRPRRGRPGGDPGHGPDAPGLTGRVRAEGRRRG